MPQITGSFPVMADGNNIGTVNIELNGLMTVFDCVCHFKSHDVLRLAAVCDGRYVPLGVMVPEKTSLRLKKSFSKNALNAAGYTEPVAFHLIKQGDVYSGSQEILPMSSQFEQTDEMPLEPVSQDTQPEYTPAIKESSPGEIETAHVYTSEPGADAHPASAVFEKEPEAIPIEEEPEMALQAAETEPIVYNDFPEPTEYINDFEPEIKTYPADPEQTPSGWTYIPDPRILFNDDSVKEACHGVSGAYITEQDDCILLAVPVLPNEPFPMMPVFCFGYSGEIGGQEYIVFKIKNGNLIL